MIKRLNALLLCLATPLAAQDAAPAVVAIENVTLVPMDTERVVAGQTVIVRGRRIATIGSTATTSTPEGALRIEGRGKFLIPGLAEMHGHFPGGQALAQLGEEYADRLLFLSLANGITTVRGMLGGTRDLRVREEIARGQRLGPQIFVAGPSRNQNSVPTVEASWRMVTEQRAAGYDLLKVHPGVRREVFDAAVAIARREAIPFAGHIPADVGLVHALRSGIRSVEHLDGYVEALLEPSAQPANPGFFGFAAIDQVDEAKLPALVAATKKAGAWNTPTQVLIENLYSDETPEALAERPEMRYMPRAMVQQWTEAVRKEKQASAYTLERARRFVTFRRRLIKALHEAGAGLLLGADTPQILLCGASAENSRPTSGACIEKRRRQAGTDRDDSLGRASLATAGTNRSAPPAGIRGEDVG